MLQSFALLVIAILGLMLPVIAQHKSEFLQKSEKACAAEWRAEKAANRTKGLSEKAYVEQCRNASAIAQAAPGPSGSTTGAASPLQKSSHAPAGTGNEFASAAEAKSRCGSDPIVRINERSKTYVVIGDKRHGTGKRGTFMCEQDARAHGMRAKR